MTILKLVLPILVCMGTGIFAEDGPVAELQKIEWFSFGGVGIAGTISDGEKSYNAILAGDSAVEDFHKILTNGTPEAKAYALYGLATVSPDEFANLSKTVDKKETVSRMFGCIPDTISMGAVLRMIKGNLRRSKKED